MVLSAMREFWLGLTRPSLPALLVTLAAPFAGLGACAWWITEDLVASTTAHRYFAAHPDDQYLYLTHRALWLSRQTTEVPEVLLIGASGSMRAITDADQLADLVEAQGVARPRVLRLESEDQSVLESLALLESLRPDFDGVVVAEVSTRRLSRGVAADFMSADRLRYRLGLRTDLYKETARKAGLEIGEWSNYFLDNQWFYLARLRSLIGNLVGGPVEEAAPTPLEVRADVETVRDRRGSWPKLGANQWQRRRAEYRELLGDGYLERAEECLAAYADAAQQRPNATFVLLECPISPRGIEEIVGRELYASHLQRMRELAAQTRLEYWNLNDEMDFAESDFRDWIHLQRYSTQLRFTTALAKRLASLRGSQVQGGGSR